jgi:hypothetical protein
MHVDVLQVFATFWVQAGLPARRRSIVHHELRFKSRAEVIRAMLKTGAAVLLKEAGKRKR